MTKKYKLGDIAKFSQNVFLLTSKRSSFQQQKFKHWREHQTEVNTSSNYGNFYESLSKKYLSEYAQSLYNASRYLSDKGETKTNRLNFMCQHMENLHKLQIKYAEEHEINPIVLPKPQSQSFVNLTEDLYDATLENNERSVGDKVKNIFHHGKRQLDKCTKSPKIDPLRKRLKPELYALRAKQEALQTPGCSCVFFTPRTNNLEKADILGNLLRRLDNAKTVHKFYKVINDFIDSDAYWRLNDARGALTYFLGLSAESMDLFRALQCEAYCIVEYEQKQKETDRLIQHY